VLGDRQSRALVSAGDDPVQPLRRAGQAAARRNRRPPSLRPPSHIKVLEQIGVAVYVLDRQWRFRYANAAAFASWRKSADEVIGKDFLDTFPRMRDTEAHRAHLSAWERGEAVYLEVLSPIFRRWIALNLLPARNRLTVISRDIHERKLRELRREEALRQAHDLASVGQIAGGFAHDLNNALTAVIGYLELASENHFDEKLARHLKKSLQAAEHASKLSNQLLALAKKQPFAPGDVDLNSIVEKEVELLRDALPPHSRIGLRLASGLWRAHADVGQVAMALLNLALNARDAMPDGGTLTISTYNAVLDQDQRDGPRAGEYVVLSVVDTGAGMDEATLARAVEPFFTTKPPEIGSGLGLAQIQAALTRCGGAVRLRSRQGEGTTVQLLFRRAGGG
jgi:signal transduction histidine kinase